MQPCSSVSVISLCSSAVRQAREAALDAQLLVVATDLGKEKASQLFAEGTAFDPTAFAEHLVSEFIVYTHYIHTVLIGNVEHTQTWTTEVAQCPVTAAY